MRTRGKHRHSQAPASKAQLARRVVAVLLWALGIIAGLIGGNYALPIALVLLVAGFFVFVSAPAGRR
jgi:hypothetical protein